MFNSIHRFQYSATSLSVGLVAMLAVVYIGLIAVVMSYAALTIEFSQSVRNEETAVAALEGQYLGTMTRITKIDYSSAGYSAPSAKVFVPEKSVTALR